MKNLLAICGAVICLAACESMNPDNSSVADEHAGMDMGGAKVAFQDPIDYIPSALGSYEWKITTDSEQAQAYFKQGMQLRYAYNVNEAARSMAEARRLDPECAMCYWGEAFALGSFLNGVMSAEKGPYAREAIQKAAALSGNVSEVERDLIMAAQIRYPENWDPGNRRPTDEAFAAEMAKVYEKYPDNHDVAVVYAVALFMLEERRGYRDIADPDLVRLHGVLTGVLEEDIAHPGACHLYIHATESSQTPGLALDCADHLSDAVPVASHIQHMPSHTWNEVGQWGKSVRANTFAYQSDLKAAKNQGFSYAPTHNLHMLLFAASYDGQGAAATQAGKDYRKASDNAMYEVLTLVRFGRFDEVVEKNNRPVDEVGAALWEFAFGYASLKEGDMKTAKSMRDKTLEFAETTDKRFRFHPAGRVVGTVAHILEGEILWAEHDLNGAIAAFEKAAEVEDSMDYDEPEPLPFAARHWLGAALIEAGRYADAEKHYRTELKDHPHDVWSLHGIRIALEKQGRIDPDINADFDMSTARMDVWITSSRF